MTIGSQSYSAKRRKLLPPQLSWAAEANATLRLAWPLVIAQLAQMALFTTDVIMMGWLGPAFLGAGTLTIMSLHPFFLFGIGILTAVAPLIAQAMGSSDFASIRHSVRQGFWVALLISAVMTPVVWNFGPIFKGLGQTDEISLLARLIHRGVETGWRA